MSVSHPKIKVMLANHSTGAIWAFPVKDIIERSATKTLPRIKSNHSWSQYSKQAAK
jgi:hypothetical protein